MADYNIKIVGNVLNSTIVSRYSDKDENLLLAKNLINYFGGEKDYIECYIYDIAGNLLNSQYNYFNYKLPSSTGLSPSTSFPINTTGNIQTTDVGIVSTLAPNTSSLYPIIEIDPVMDVQTFGYTSGEFKIKYNFFEKKISNDFEAALFIKEISPDRTEVRLASLILSDEEIEKSALELIDKINNSEYYVDYLLNFGEDVQVVAVNVALNKAPEGYEILFKLYQPLPSDIEDKTQLWVVEEKVSPYEFNINLDKLLYPPPPLTLRGPNFDIEIDNVGTVGTPYTNYQTLINNIQSLQNSSYQKILALLTSQSADINIDYTDYNNFVFFGSANQRLTNFYTKAKQIEDYNSLINTYTPLSSSTPSLITEINSFSSSINNIIAQFDGYESYLYFESSSYSWPKSTSVKPFQLLSTGSLTTINWYNAASLSSSLYDKDNINNLEYAIPSYLVEDKNNQPFLTFLNMVGHYFDNIWIYLKSIPDLNVANNNLEKGISKDLVYYQLQSLGLKLYNSQAGENVDQYLIGSNTGSSIWDNNTTTTGSYLNNIPRKDLVSELYKRIYHNLPLLLKQKGTVEGLDNLMTVFGIPNRTYYTIISGSISESFYTPTGSSSTASILNVKEYGGTLKANLIKGYNNDKVKIISNELLTGSLLSPIASLQTYTTASSQFRDDDLHFVDISFSPQSQINTYVSKSITSSNATWSLDDYIGDPRYMYSSSYGLLEIERIKYYKTGVSGYPGFTSSYLDYNGFIRLIEYFDNALFKMLGDFVPERASLSTGVTFESPVLERNKVVYPNPTSTITQSVYTATYNTTQSLSSDYGKFYNALSDNKKAWYDGNISGSIVDVNEYFEDNYNPYLQPISYSFSSQTLYAFQHSDWNVMLNNVSKSVNSLIRKNIEYVYGTTSSIIYPAELQDSYLTLQSYNNSRYEGTKLTSLKYNIYTSSSYTGSDGINIQEGDISYGKAASTDKYVRKIGLFTQIASSSFLPKRNNVSLKYIVDEFGGLTELNQLNNNWEDVQRTFLMGSRPNISLFDNKKYSNQKSTDGNKLVFDSGYTYAPILYFATCSIPPCTSCDHYLSFEGASDEPDSYTAIARNSLNPNAFVSGSPSPRYPVSASYIMNLFDSITEGAEYFVTGSTTTFPSYSVKETADYDISISLPATWSVTSPPPASSSWYLQVYKKSVGGGETLITQNIYTWAAGDPPAVTLTWTQFTGNRFFFQLDQPILSQPITIAGASVTGYQTNDCFVLSPYYANQANQAIMSAGSTFASVGKSAPNGWPSITYISPSVTGLTINGTFVSFNSSLPPLTSGCVITVKTNINSCQNIA